MDSNLPIALPDPPATDKVMMPVNPLLANRDRVTLVLDFYHEHRGEAPLSLQYRCASFLETTDEQPYSRRIVVGPEWKDLDLGYLKDSGVGYVAVENIEGRDALVNPTAIERAGRESKVVEISYGSGNEAAGWLIKPGWPFVGLPTHPQFLRLRCVNGPAKCRITIFPK